MRITIIGAGLCGTALAGELVGTLPEGVDVCLVGDAASFGRGVAYGLARPEHYLNVRAHDLGLDAGAPGGFADWLDLSDGARQGVLPRELYGDYLAQHLDDAVARSDGRLRLVRETVIGVRRLQDGYRIHLADGGDFRSDLVVLALGALPPRVLPELDAALAVDPRYIGRPWTPDALDGVPSDARVLVVGTGLTMADVVTTLRRQGHAGPVTAISRHGLLPQPHRATRQPPIAPPALQKVAEDGSLRELVRALRAMAAVADDWRPLVDGLRPYTQELWQRLDDGERRRFLRHLRAHWEVHRHRIAPEVAAVLQADRDAGRLQVEAAHLLHARAERAGLRALLRPRGSEHAQARHFDVIVRATGFDTDIFNTRHALVSHLREAELVVPDPLGLGVQATPAGEVLDRHGVIVPGLSVLGPLQRGQWWEITAIPELRDAARTLAARLRRDAAPVRVSAFDPLPRVVAR